MRQILPGIALFGEQQIEIQHEKNERRNAVAYISICSDAEQKLLLRTTVDDDDEYDDDDGDGKANTSCT